MKTTVEIPDELLGQVKAQADRDGTTVKALIEEGLRRVLTARKSSGPFKLKKASFRGKGLQPGVEGGTWEKIREMIYEGRGA